MSTTIDLDGFILTRGQRLTDMLVQALVHSRSGAHSVGSRAKVLREYIEELDGDGEAMVEAFVAAYLHSFSRLRNVNRLRHAATSRRTLEAYIRNLEISAGRRPANPEQREIAHRKKYSYRKAQGWGVCKNRHGRWRISLTSIQDGHPHQLKGTYRTRREARAKARATIAKLREDAA